MNGGSVAQAQELAPAAGRSGCAATVLITSKNRGEELRVAIASAIAQTIPVEVLVIDDGSTDGTAELVRREFPKVRLIRHEESRGLIVRRNEGAELAVGGIVFSIDDDAAFPSPRTVEQTLRDFSHPRIGAVAIPFINVRQDDAVRQRATTDAVDATFTYIGTAHALRRDVFLRLGGYRSQLVHQGEEGDYCLRMLAAGYIVRLGTADPIHHFESPRRDYRRMDYYGRRNDILYAWHNVPMPAFPIHLLGVTVNGVRHGFRVGRVARMISGLWGGYASIPREWNQRRPVDRKIYRLARRLKSRVAIPLSEIESELPALAEA